MRERLFATWLGALIVSAPLAAGAFVAHRSDDGGGPAVPPFAGGAGPTVAPLPVAPTAPQGPRTGDPLRTAGGPPRVLDRDNPFVAGSPPIEASPQRARTQPIETTNPYAVAKRATSDDEGSASVVPRRIVRSLDIANPFGPSEVVLPPMEEWGAPHGRALRVLEVTNPYEPASSSSFSI